MRTTTVVLSAIAMLWWNPLFARDAKPTALADSISTVTEHPKATIIDLGIVTKDSVNGVTITSVRANSQADKAGLLPGDIILSVQGVTVSKSEDIEQRIYPLFLPPQKISLRPDRALERQVFPPLLPYQPATFIIQRGGTKIEKPVVPLGTVRLEVNDRVAKFVVPGVPAERLNEPKNAVDALDKINVLKKVLLDRKTGAIELVGSYDEQFPTGPIPYLDLLKTAIDYPQPAFDLKPNCSDKDLERLPQPFSAGRIFALLFGHPALECDRQRLIRLTAKQYGIRPEEYAMLSNYFVLDDRGGAVPTAIARIQENALRNMGYEQAARGWAALAGSATTDSAAEALRILGKEPGSYPGSMRVQAILALIDNIGHSAGRWGGQVRDVAEGRMTEADLIVALHKAILPEWDKTGKKHALADLFQELVLSDEAVHLLGQGSAISSKVVPKNLDTTSQIHRIFYEADYSLKSLNMFPELFRDVPKHRENKPQTVRPPDYRPAIHSPDTLPSIRSWFEPRKVDMQFSDDKTVISFGAVEMLLLVDLDPDPVVVKSDPAWDQYCLDFCSHYDQYAHILPSLHELRETAKVIALARWINAEKIPVQLSGVTQEKWNPPSEVAGKFMIAFKILDPEPGLDAFDAIRAMWAMEGGINLRGKNWTSYTPAPTSETQMPSALTLSNQLGQKAAQAAVSGNLENASHLAELSAQAMTGAVTRNDLAKMNISVPEAKATAVSPASVQLHKEMCKKTYQQINALVKNPAAGGAATANLNQINNFYEQVRNNPAAAPDYLAKLQTGQVLHAQPPAVPPQTAAGITPPTLLANPQSTEDAKPPTVTNSIGMQLLQIPAGKLVQRVTQPFMLGKTEVTQSQWEKVMGTKPWVGQSDVQTGDDFPAAYVSWDDAIAFCKKLTELEHKSGKLPANEEYRLPTEAEWEYACRAGTTTRFSFGDDDSKLGEYAWFRGNTIGSDQAFAHKVGTKKPNLWGLHDMHGNMLEWSSDWFGPLTGDVDPVGPAVGSNRVNRGGSWGNDPVDCRSASRFSMAPSLRNGFLGFRVARSPSVQ